MIDAPFTLALSLHWALVHIVGGSIRVRNSIDDFVDGLH
jgi:hypothetical protein